MMYTIRAIRPVLEEFEAVMAIDKKTFDDCPYTAEALLERINLETYPMFVAETDDGIVGFISFMKVQTLHYSGLWIDLVAVKPELSGKGVGRQLIHAGEQLAIERGVDFRSALIREDNISSIKAFEAEGFSWDHQPFRLYFK